MIQFQGLTRYRTRQSKKYTELYTEVCFHASFIFLFFSYASILSFEFTHEQLKQMDFVVKFMKQKI